MRERRGGWIKLHFSVLEKDIGKNSNLFGIWVFLLLRANWKEGQILWKGEKRTVHPGQAIYGIRELSDRWGCSPATILRWIRHLHDTGRILNETSTKGSIATICNWDKYQHTEIFDTKQDEHGLNTDRTRTERIEESTDSKNKTKTRAKPLVEYPTGFLEIYHDYPRKEGKSAGFKIYQRQIKTEQDRADLCAAVRNYQVFLARTETQPKFTKQFSTFMGEWRDWLDPETGNVMNLFSPVNTKPIQPR